MIKKPIDKEHQLYSTNCLQSLSSEKLFHTDFMAHIENQECEHIGNDILCIDATGTKTDRIKGFNKILYYVAAIRQSCLQITSDSSC